MKMEETKKGEKRKATEKWRYKPLVIEEDKLEPINCFGYSRHRVLSIVTYVLCILTVGFLLLVFYWKPNWRLKMMYKKCLLHDADAVLIQDVYHREHVKFIQHLKVNDESTLSCNDVSRILKKNVVINDELRFFCYQKMKYIWDEENYTFFLLRSPELSTPCIDFFHEYQAGLSEKDVTVRQEIFGLNKITIDVKPILVMFVQEVLNPFYVFQIYSITIWMMFEYWSFSMCILVMTLISLAMSLYITRKQSITLREMADSNLKVRVIRPNGTTVVETEDQLVPGDVLIIPQGGCTMTCDAVLINGTCIVNESMLTGESVPVTKVSLSSRQSLDEQSHLYSPDTDKRHTLFCGTQVIQTRQSGGDMAKAVVVQTGFSTMKGLLVRSILYPRPMEFKLYRDAMMFVGSYIALAFVGVAYSIWVLANSGTGPRLTFLLTLDSITIAVQPLLPVALTIGMLYAQIRLKKQGIFCISPQRINLSGILDVVCFDKTGTLTEDGLDLLGIRRIVEKTFLPMETTATSLTACAFLHTMATCHSLAIIDGQLQGDPMDLKMFQATGWTLEESEMSVGGSEKGKRHLICVKPPISDQSMSEFAVLKQFTFSSSLQRMSVIAESQTTRKLAGFVKGSPEMILALSTPSSVPDDFNMILNSYTAEGFRVIAIAWKPLDDDITADNCHAITRNELESDLTFVGILVWQNKLKPESLPVITELRESSIRTIMVTGDNILTAISVAGNCGMLDPDDTIVQVDVPSDDTVLKEQLIYKKVNRNLSCDTVDANLNEDGCQESLIRKTGPGRIHYALDGKTFAAITERFAQSLPSILLRGTVFARMAPDQKQDLIEALQKLDYYVGMCGDGANDCGALKTAHAGISLSEAEASVASPFTSKIANVTCVPMVIKEGRSALVTSFGLFMYIALYTFVMYVTVSITKKFGLYPSNFMFALWDIIMATTIVLLMGRSGPHDKIAKEKPPTRLLRAPNMFSLVIHVVVMTVSQMAALFMAQNQDWYEVTTNPDDFKEPAFETTTVFFVANFQFMIYAIAFTPGRPFRAPIWSNPLYLVDLVLLTLLSIFFLFAPLPGLESFLGIKQIPDFKFRVMLFALVVGNCVVSFLIQFLIIPREIVQKMLRCWRKEKLPKFKHLEMEMQTDLNVTSESIV